MKPWDVDGRPGLTHAELQHYVDALEQRRRAQQAHRPQGRRGGSTRRYGPGRR